MTDSTVPSVPGADGRRAQILELLRRESATAAAGGPAPRRRGGPVPLSYAQETLWFLDRLDPGRPTYNVPVGFRIRGELDLAALRSAFATVVERHEALRTYVMDQSDGPVQLVADEVPAAPDLSIAEGDDPRQRAARAHLEAEELAAVPFDLASPPLWTSRLIRIDDRDHLLVFVVHHIIFDGWSLGVFARELGEAYAAAAAGREAGLDPVPLQYADYSEWQREWLRDRRLDDLTSYWTGRLEGLGTVDIPTDRPRPARVTNRGTFTLHRIEGEDLLTRVSELARSGGVSRFSVYLAAFYVLLHRYTGQDDLVVGSPSANRGLDEVADTVGFFITMLVLRQDLSGDPAFRELLTRVGTSVRGAFAHGDLPFGRLVEAVAPERDPSRSPLFQIAFTFRDADGSPLGLPGADVSQSFLDPGTSRFDMSWNVTEGRDAVELNLEFNTDLFDLETARRLTLGFERLLRAVVEDPDARLSAVETLSRDEALSLVHDRAGPVRPRPPASFTDLFAEVVARKPEETAVVVDGVGLTYGELNARANGVAHQLRELGARPGELVAFCLPRGVDLLVALLGVVKSGAAYLPLDPVHPPNRIGGVLRDADPRAVISSRALAGRLPGDRDLLLAEDFAAPRADDPEPLAGSEDLAYVLYTSGSTGRPKGVEIRWSSVTNFVASVRELFDLTSDDRILGFTSVTFDVSVFEIFSALLCGAGLYLATDEERTSIDRLQTLIERAGITVVDLPPAMMELLEPERFDALRIVFVGGEAFSRDLVDRWGAAPGRRFFNGYGPTECTVTMIVDECAVGVAGSPPIGLPMANHVAHVVDADLRLVPPGVVGELLVGGAGLARGYRGDPDLTGTKFVADPFGSTAEGRLFRTGDLVRRLNDGRLVFVGRTDHQIQLRGLRIELGEIETALGAHESVGQHVVVAHTSGSGVRQLVAYVTANDGKAVETSEMRAHLADLLPAYMIPAHVVTVPTLPLNSSGKVDRTALPEPPSPAAAVDEELRSETERIVRDEIFGTALGMERIARHADFFEIGGNSLQAARLLSHIRRRFDVEITMADFFRSPTVAHLGALVDRHRISGLDDDALLRLLESMPEEEVDRLMGTMDVNRG